MVTIVLFIWQQKMFMPPAADEQAAMQQKIMQYMMIFMGLLFFKVASGLCIYFIASSLWGVARAEVPAEDCAGHAPRHRGDRAPGQQADGQKSRPQQPRRKIRSDASGHAERNPPPRR